MPDLPLPKPSGSNASSSSSGTGQVSPPKSTSANPVSPTNTSSPSPSVLTPPPSTLKIQPPPPAPSPNSSPSPANFSVGQKQAATSDAINSSPTAPKSAIPQVAPPGRPAPMGAPLPPPPTQSAGGSSNLPPSSLASSPQPLQRPPGVVSALSSMASNQLPNNTAPPPNAQAATPQPQIAKPKSPLAKFLPFIVGGLAVLLVVVFAFSKLFGGSSTTPAAPAVNNNQVPGGASSTNPPQGGQANTNQPAQTSTVAPAQTITLEYWGLWEPDPAMTDVIAQFEQANPGIKVKYSKQSHQDYRERLQTALASGNGPDLFRFHASWTPMLRAELSPLPNSVYSTSEFKNIFYPVALDQLSLDGQLMGVPLMYDGLMLYYNTEIFETAGVQPPTTWAELRTLAAKLTVRSTDGIQRGGLAIGNAVNVDHFSDILAVLMLQNGADLMKPNSPETRDALLFYTNFVKADKVWDDTLPSSTIAFARGEAAMMFAPSWRAHEISAINPDLRFATTTLPKLSDNRLAWASYWAEGVSNFSQKKDAAWKFVKFMSSPEIMKQMYSKQSQIRAFGEPYSRQDLADNLATNPIVKPLLSDAPYARGWYLSSFTHDNGINDQLIKYYEDAVTAILGGKNSNDVLTTLEQGTLQVLRQYGVKDPRSI